MSSIYLNKNIFSKVWYFDGNAFRVFMHLILSAKGEPSNTLLGELAPGQLITSVGNISHDLKLSSKQVRIALDKLTDSGEIVCMGASYGTQITVCNYGDYIKTDSTEGKPLPQSNEILFARITELESEIALLKNTPVLDPEEKEAIRDYLQLSGSGQVKKRRVPKKKDPEDYTIGKKLSLIYSDYFKGIHNTVPYMTAKEAVAFKQISEKVASMLRDAGTEISDQTICDTFAAVLQNTKDSWVLSNMDPTFINSQWIKIIIKLKQNGNGKRPATSDADLLRIFFPGYGKSGNTSGQAGFDENFNLQGNPFGENYGPASQTPSGGFSDSGN